jgi:hypothetical protein
VDTTTINSIIGTQIVLSRNTENSW